MFTRLQIVFQLEIWDSRRLSSESRVTRVFRLPIRIPRENGDVCGAAA